MNPTDQKPSPSAGALRAAQLLYGNGYIEEANFIELSALIIDYETGLPQLLEALKPFTEAAKEVRAIAGISPQDQWVWKPQNGNKSTAGISTAHLFKALELVALAEGR